MSSDEPEDTRAKGRFDDTRDEVLRGAGVSEHAGFPNPAIDRAIQTLDLNRLLIRHTAATYLMRIEGDSWQPLGIFDGDIVVVDRALGYGPNDLTVWWEGESFVISHQNQIPKDTETWGVVSATVHRFRKWDART